MLEFFLKENLFAKYVAFWCGYLPSLLRGERVRSRQHLLIDVEDDRFNRYLYLLIIFFVIEGWRVSVRHRFKYLSSKDPYSLEWLKTGKVRLVFRDPSQVTLHLTTKRLGKACPGRGSLSADYFGRIHSTESWRVPMAMHPMQYGTEWLTTHHNGDRERRGIVFAGNTDMHLYGNASITGKFGMPNRNESIECLKNNFSADLLQDLGQQCPYAKIPCADKLFLLDRLQSDIPGACFREMLARFAFALALPGWAVPLCHNAVEALSVGCVPIIHRTYAKHLHSELKDGVNCLMYTNLTELVEAVRRALSMETWEVGNLSRNARALYDSYFTPSAVVDGVVAAVNGCKTIRLFAELESLRLLSAEE